MKPPSRGCQILRAWMVANGFVRPNGALDTRRLAERYMRRTGPVKGVRERTTPPYAGIRAIVAGEARPRWDTRIVLADITGGMVTPEDFDEPAGDVEP